MVRGIRNNNPLNIRRSGDKWKGMLPEEEQTDKAFFRFITMAYGFRAAFRLIDTYMTKYGCNTIRLIISRWAPKSENDTEAYIERVCRETLYGGEEVIYRWSPMLKDIVWAMAKVECGAKAVMPYAEALEEGWEMAREAK